MGAFERLLTTVAADELAGRASGRSRVLAGVMLVLANCVPLAGVLWFGWLPGDVLIIYWVENVVVGLWAFVRILTARGTGGPTVTSSATGQPVSRGFLAPFFCVHYGIFTLVHGGFTFALAAMTGWDADPAGYAIAVAALMASHGYAFAARWIGQGERDTVSPQQAMISPYGRIIVLHLAVLGGFFLLFRSSFSGEHLFPGLPGGEPETEPATELGPMLLLIALKIGLDLVLLARSVRGGRRVSSAQRSTWPTRPPT